MLQTQPAPSYPRPCLLPSTRTEDRGRWGHGCLMATGGPETIPCCSADLSACQEVGQGLGHTPPSPSPGVCTSSCLGFSKNLCHECCQQACCVLLWVFFFFFTVWQEFHGLVGDVQVPRECSWCCDRHLSWQTVPPHWLSQAGPGSPFPKA